MAVITVNISDFNNKIQVLEEERLRQQEMDEKMEVDRLRGLEQQRIMEQKRLDSEIQLREILKQQMAELKRREEEV